MLKGEAMFYPTKTLITSVAAAVFLILAPLTAEAQQAENVPRIGYLFQGSKASQRVSGFRQGLRELGYVEGQNITVEYQFGIAKGRRARLDKLAAELVGMRLDVIVAATTASTRAP